MAQREITSVTRTPQPVRVSLRSGTWPWVFQRITAYGLIVFLGVHMYFNHFARLDETTPITFQLVNQRFSLYPILYALNDSLLIICSLFHGMNGVRNVLYDLTTNRALRIIGSVILAIIAIGFSGYGAWVLWTLANTTV
ncbi:MAG TPA: hypothetical protein VGE07_12225 [Herpetosiphonaceae bacterium]